MSIKFQSEKIRILITGGAGFIGSCLIKKLLENKNATIFNLDKVSYTSDFAQINESKNLENYNFLKVDICDYKELKYTISEAKPNLIFNLAAESHVDRSIDNSKPFIESNIIGTYNMLEISKEYWLKLDNSENKKFRFLHVSTDEVFGSLGKDGLFSESTAYDPRSPYSASKAASDHLTNAWFHTFNLPVIRTNCSNNFGPYQFPDKLIPLIITKALDNKEIPIYGDGENIRDWLFVEDHVDALIIAITKGVIGQKYCIGGNNEKSNLQIVNSICELLDKKQPREKSYKTLIRFVEDRAGHDKRYAIDSRLIRRDLKWEPKYKFKKGLNLTVDWYLNNQNWCKSTQKSNYKGERLGLNNFQNNNEN